MSLDRHPVIGDWTESSDGMIVTDLLVRLWSLQEQERLYWIAAR